MKKYRRINKDERIKVAMLRAEGKSFREIARRLGRAHSTIIREVEKRGRLVRQGTSWRRVYTLDDVVSATTHDLPGVLNFTLFEEGRELKKILKNKDLRVFVATKLGLGWSPKQIASAVRIMPDLPNVSYGTIYRIIKSTSDGQAIYNEGKKRKARAMRRSKSGLTGSSRLR